MVSLGVDVAVDVGDDAWVVVAVPVRLGVRVLVRLWDWLGVRDELIVDVSDELCDCDDVTVSLGDCVKVGESERVCETDAVNVGLGVVVELGVCACETVCVADGVSDCVIDRL